LWCGWLPSWPFSPMSPSGGGGPFAGPLSRRDHLTLLWGNSSNPGEKPCPPAPWSLEESAGGPCENGSCSLERASATSAERPTESRGKESRWKTLGPVNPSPPCQLRSFRALISTSQPYNAQPSSGIIRGASFPAGKRKGGQRSRPRIDVEFRCNANSSTNPRGAPPAASAPGGCYGPAAPRPARRVFRPCRLGPPLSPTRTRLLAAPWVSERWGRSGASTSFFLVHRRRALSRLSSCRFCLAQRVRAALPSFEGGARGARPRIPRPPGGARPAKSLSIRNLLSPAGQAVRASAIGPPSLARRRSQSVKGSAPPRSRSREPAGKKRGGGASILTVFLCFFLFLPPLGLFLPSLPARSHVLTRHRRCLRPVRAIQDAAPPSPPSANPGKIDAQALLLKTSSHSRRPLVT